MLPKPYVSSGDGQPMTYDKFDRGEGVREIYARREEYGLETSLKGKGDASSQQPVPKVSGMRLISYRCLQLTLRACVQALEPT